MVEQTTDKDETLKVYYTLLNNKQIDVIYDNLLSSKMKKEVKRADFRQQQSSGKNYTLEQICDSENSKPSGTEITAKGTYKLSGKQKEQNRSFEQKFTLVKDGKYWKIQSIEEIK